MHIYGWVETHIGGARGSWSGALQIDHLVDRNRKLFDCLYEPEPGSGLIALQRVRGFPDDISAEMRSHVKEYGYDSEPSSAFHIPWSSLANIKWARVVEWPRLDIELWWQRAPGEYELKSNRHDPAKLSREELTTLLETRGSYDKAQYRYVVREGREQVTVSRRWRCLFTAMGLWAKRLGPDCVRLVGFFE